MESYSKYSFVFGYSKEDSSMRFIYIVACSYNSLILILCEYIKIYPSFDGYYE